jgi:tetratricopeptide (TPR) repeat protein
MSPARQSRFPAAITGFLAELKRRRVLQIGGAYVAGAWLGAEILSFLLEQFQAPDWTYRFLAIVFVVGFPLTMIFAWIVQVQEDGTWTIDPSRGDYRTVAVAVALGVLVTAGLSWLMVPERKPTPNYEPLANSLAVLPLPDSNELYRSLVAGLEQSDGLSLVRLEYSEIAEDLLSTGRSLRVKMLAHGRPTGPGGSGRIELELLDVVDGETLWASTFDRDPNPQIETGLAMANGLLEALGLPALTREEFTGTASDEAFEALLAGMAYASSAEPASLATAVEFYQQAIELDPGYVRAHVGLAQTIYDLLTTAQPGGIEPGGLEKRAAAAVASVRNLAPKSADAIYLAGLFSPNSQLSIQAFERAIELDPDHYPSYFRYAILMKESGKLKDAERLIRQALLYQPMNERFKTELAEITRLQSSG